MAVAVARTYKPVLEDVGEYLALYWLPIRSDNKQGNPLVAISDGPVIPGIYALIRKNGYCYFQLGFHIFCLLLPCG